jgi:hypothetical protein
MRVRHCSIVPRPAQTPASIVGKHRRAQRAVAIPVLVVDEQSTVGVTVALSPEDAIRVAYAVRSAAIDIAKVTGEIGTADPASVMIGDFDE